MKQWPGWVLVTIVSVVMIVGVLFVVHGMPVGLRLW